MPSACRRFKAWPPMKAPGGRSSVCLDVLVLFTEVDLARCRSLLSQFLTRFECSEGESGEVAGDNGLSASCLIAEVFCVVILGVKGLERRCLC